MNNLTMNKVRSSFAKRFKITRKGKILRRKSGLSHNFAKKTSLELRRKRWVKLDKDFVLDYKNY